MNVSVAVSMASIYICIYLEDAIYVCIYLEDDFGILPVDSFRIDSGTFKVTVSF